MAKATITCLDIHGKPHETTVDKLSWHPSAYGIIIKEGKILLGKWSGKYCVPGGSLEFGEDPETALLREIQEETGVTARNPKLVACRTSLFKEPNREDSFIQSILLFFTCEYVGGQLSLEGMLDYEQELGGEMPEWVRLEDVPDLPAIGSFDWKAIIREVADNADTRH